MTDKEDIDKQLELLQAHRRTLATLLMQEAKLGTAYTPPGVNQGIREARAYIRHCKRSLRTWGILIADHPNDEDPAIDNAGEQRRAPAKHAFAVETQRKLVRRIVPVDRDDERLNFQRMLRREIPCRGMIIHSNGQGGWGKSSLLKIFDEECADCPSPITEALLFDPGDTGADWKLIMDRTVHAIGESYFPKYRTISTSGSVHNHYGYSFSTNEEINDTSDGNDATWKPVDDSSQSSSRSGRTSDRADLNLLTRFFIEEFREAPKPEQLVWLVDAVEQLDDDTLYWLRTIFRHIALNELQNLILVLAGRDQFNASRDWGDRIKQTRLGPLDIPAVVDLLEQGGWDGTKQERRAFAKQLIKQTGGHPLAIRSLLDQTLLEREV